MPSRSEIERLTQRFADKTTIHGVPDFYYAGVGGRIFWGILAIIAIVGLSMQLEGVIYQFAEEATGATMTQYFPEHMPVVAVCPDRWVSQEKAEAMGIDSQTVSVINGFMPLMGITELFALQGGGGFEDRMSAEFDMTEYIGPGGPFDKAREIWINAGRNIEGLVNATALDELETYLNDIYPLGAKLEQKRVTTMTGVCFAYESSLTVNALQSTYAGIKLAFNISGALASQIGREKPFFRVNLSPVGSQDISYSSHQTLHYGNHYLLLYTVTKITRVSTRKWPCDDITRGEMGHCQFGHGNKVAPGKSDVRDDLDGCHTAIPSTGGHNKSMIVDKPCNTFVDLQGSSLLQFVNLNYTDLKWNGICPRACSFSTYQYTFQLEKELFPPDQVEDAYTIIEVKASEGMSGLEINEYLLMGPAGMLSNVGGTLGLWIGASVMSIFQILYIFCLERMPCLKKKEKLDDGGKEARY